MEKPRIIVFTTSYDPFIGGAEIAIQQVAKRNAGKFDFFILTSRFRKDLPGEEMKPEGKVIRLGIGSRVDKVFFPILGCIKGFRLLFGGGKTAIWGMDISHGSLAGALLSFFSRVPFILSIQYGESERRIARGRLGLINAAFRLMLAQTSFVAAESSYLLVVARKYGYKGRGEVFPNGVEIEKFQNKSANPPDSKIIVTTSRLVYKNGIDILIRAMAEVKKTIPGSKLHIIGDGPLRQGLEALVRKLSLQEQIKFFGNIPHDKIPVHLHEAGVFARPSRSEGMGNSFIEALAAGLPIVGTPVGGIVDIIKDGETGLFCRSEDAKDCADKIIRLLQDENLSSSIVARGKKMVEARFSWDNISLKYASLFYRGETSIVDTIEVSPLRILIATPLLPPQLGGPALYALNLAKEFSLLGKEVKIVSFGRYLRFPSGIRHFFCLCALARQAVRSDLVFALDYTSVGLPAALVSLIFRKPLVIRVEGDFLWESFVERTRRDIILKEFYGNPSSLNQKEILIKMLSGWVMRQATSLIFSSEWRRQMVIGAYNVSLGKTVIINNVFPSPSVLGPKAYGLEPKVILWAGRVLYHKNLYRLIRAFAKISAEAWELHIIGDGPEKGNLENFVQEEKISGVRFFSAMDRHELQEKMAEASFFILPTLSEVGPNIISEAMGTYTPCIMTAESGYKEYLSDFCLFIDPLSENDIYEKLKIMIDEPVRKQAEIKLQSFKGWRDWSVVAKDWVEIFEEVKN